MDDCKQMATPGVKKAFTDEIMDLPVSDDADFLKSLDVRMTRVKLDEEHVEHVIPYSKIDGRHPAKFVFDRGGRFVNLNKSDDPYCGVPKREIATRTSKCSRDNAARARILCETLLDGPAWEMSTAEMILAVSKKTFKAKRVGAKASKALEFESKGEILVASEATLFRALAARAKYLAMDRPECASATKELCRFFATPIKTGVEQLERLIRYLAGAKRLVWRF